MSIEDGYRYQPPVREMIDHVRRYPRHYLAIAMFTALLLLVPRVGSDSSSAPPLDGRPPTSVADRSGSAAAPDSTPDSTLGRLGVTPSGPVLAAPALGPSTVAGVPIPPSAADRGTGGTPPTPGTPGTPAPPEPEEPSGVPLDIPPPPALPLPPVPAELRPLLGAVAPLTTQGCSAIGLAAVVAAVGATAAQGVPVAEILPYVAPAYTVCASFPVPEGERSICAVDEAMRAAGYPADASGLAKTPNIIGLGVDVLAGIDQAVEAYTGSNPGLADQIGAQLGCRPDLS